MGQRQDSLEKLERVYTGDPPEADLRSRVGLSLSGGGYKACTFHMGSLLRLYEMGLLHKIDRVSSVSGGSIAAAWLALQWRKLHFEPSGAPANFHEVIFKPLWRGGSVSLNGIRGWDKWISASVMPPPGLAAAG